MFQVDNVNSFEWVKQLRYYWDPDLDNCVVRMSNSMYIYGYEYLGASARLVITPLTVRHFLYICVYGMCSFRKCPFPPHGTSLEIQKGKEKYETNLELLRG